MARRISSITVAALAGLGLSMPVLTGCSATPQQTRVDVPDRVTADDWRAFSDELVYRLNQNGVLDRYDQRLGRTPVLAIGDFQNNTTRQSFSRTKNFLYNELQSAIINSGRAEINRDVAGVGGTRERLLDDLVQLRNDPNYNPDTIRTGVATIPDLVMFGDINADEVSDGRATQFDYQVRVELIDTERRTAVWSEVINLTKLWSRPGVR